MKLENITAYGEDGKKVASFRLTPEQIEYLRQHPNASKLIRQSIDQSIKKQATKEETDKITEKLAQIANKYGICNYPQWNRLEKCTGEKFYPSWLVLRPQTEKPAPQHYFEYVLCNEEHLTEKETEFLKSLDKIDVSTRQQLIRQALEATLEKTEIKKGYPLLQFVVDHICPDLAKAESYLDTKPIKDRFTVTELASKAKMSYDQFYRRILPKLIVILERCGWQHIIQES